MLAVGGSSSKSGGNRHGGSGSAGWRFGASLLAVAAAVGLGIGLWASRPSEEPVGSTVTSSGDAGLADREPQAHAPAVGRELRAEFAIFRSPAEELPASMVQTLAKSRYRADWELAQRLDMRQPAWVAPGRRFVCIVYEDRASGALGQSCDSWRRLTERGLFVATLAADDGPTGGERVVFGVVPDGVRQVSVRTPGFGSKTARVAANAFVLRDTTTEPPEAIAFLP